MTNRNAGRVEPFEAEDVDAESVGRHTLAVEGVDAAYLAEEVARRHRVKTVLGQSVCTGKQLKLAFVHFHRQRILAPADGAVTGRQLREVRLDFKAHGAAVATALVDL